MKVIVPVAIAHRVIAPAKIVRAATAPGRTARKAKTVAHGLSAVPSAQVDSIVIAAANAAVKPVASVANVQHP